MFQLIVGTTEPQIDGTGTQDVERDQAPRPSLLTADEVAEILRVTPARLYGLARCGVLPSIRIGRQVRFAPAAIEQFIARGGYSLPLRVHGSQG
jgi:excisionase family DNA binding protein